MVARHLRHELRNARVVLARLAPRAYGQLIALAALLIVAGCAGMTPAPIFTAREVPVATSLPEVGREDLLNELSMYHGVPYREGGDSMKGIDCSGLVLQVFGPLGVKLPRTAALQFESGISVGRRDVKTGDLVFFGGGRIPDHVGVAVSSDEMVHASSSKGVVLEKIDSFAESAEFHGARRVVNLR